MLKILINSTVLSQDPIFSQLNNSPLNLNPAFAGNNHSPVIYINSRIEWPLFNFAYNTHALSADMLFKRIKIGAGVMVLMDDSGNGIYKRFKAEGIISYLLKVSENNFFKIGLGFAYGQNSLDWSKLIFGDMIDNYSGFTLPDGSSIPTEEEIPYNLTKKYFDISAGLLYYSKKIFAGVAIKHANTPANYYFENLNDAVNKGLPVRLTAQIGGEIRLFPGDSYHHRFYSPAFLYAFQSGMHQFAFNNYIDLGGFFGNIGFRHNFTNSDAVIIGAGLSKNIFKIGYSFDYTVSKLGINTGGSHELGITINLENTRLSAKEYRYSDCFGQFR